MAILFQLVNAETLASMTMDERDFIIGEMEKLIQQELTNPKTEAGQKIMSTIQSSYKTLGKEAVALKWRDADAASSSKSSR
jgi:hypothetical protein